MIVDLKCLAAYRFRQLRRMLTLMVSISTFIVGTLFLDGFSGFSRVFIKLGVHPPEY